MIMMHKKLNITAYILLILTVIFWGYSFISTKVVLSELPPVTIAFFRQIISLTFLFIWLKPTRRLEKISLKDGALLASAGFFGIILYFVFENNGIMLSTASNTSMIVASVPVFTMFTEAIFYKEKISVKKIISLLLSLIGVYLVITVNGSLDFSSSKLMGNLLVLLAMISWVVYTLINKKIGGVYKSTTMTFWQTFFCIFLFIPFIIPEIKSWKMISVYSFANLIYLSIFCSALAYVFFIYASKKLGPTICSAFLNLIPVVSVFAGFFVLGESITVLQLTGMIIIILSLFVLISRNNSSTPT